MGRLVPAHNKSSYIRFLHGPLNGPNIGIRIALTYLKGYYAVYVYAIFNGKKFK